MNKKSFPLLKFNNEKSSLFVQQASTWKNQTKYVGFAMPPVLFFLLENLIFINSEINVGASCFPPRRDTIRFPAAKGAGAKYM
jgi:hypothetical protein